jgi:hypothetical protein
MLGTEGDKSVVRASAACRQRTHHHHAHHAHHAHRTHHRIPHHRRTITPRGANLTCLLPALPFPLLLLLLLACLQAALARTTDLDPSIPTIAFLITDAPPHLASDRDSMTATHELTYLTTQRGLTPADASDAVKCFRATALQHFAGNLILNCVLYEGSSTGRHADTAVMKLYGWFAQQTGGMLMVPNSRSSTVLANGLTTVVKLLLSRVDGAAAAAAAAAGSSEGSQGSELEGFRLVDVSGLRDDVSSEAQDPGSVAYGDSAELFAIAMERMVAGEGYRYHSTAWLLLVFAACCVVYGLL